MIGMRLLSEKKSPLFPDADPVGVFGEVYHIWGCGETFRVMIKAAVKGVSKCITERLLEMASSIISFYRLCYIAAESDL